MILKTTNIPGIDDQHAQLLVCLKRLEQFAGTAHAFAATMDAMAAERTYMDEHFAYEESVLAEAGYPDLAKHARLHQGIRAEMGATWERLMAGNDVSADLIAKMQNWVVRHINEDDHEFTVWLADQSRMAESV